MKLKLEDIVEIHRLHREGLSLRQIARKTGMHRKTVRKYLNQKDVSQIEIKHQRSSKLDAYKEVIIHWLEEDLDVSAVWIYDRLVPLGFDGSYEIVKRLVSREKGERQRIAYERFETMPGLQAQVDFGEFKVERPDGTLVTLYLFTMILGYSRYIYGELISRCDLPTFLDCHIHAFEFFGGVPVEILYDRMKNVYIGKLAGRRAFNPTLLGFGLHYGFTPKVAPAYAAWVKGKVERPYSFIREGFWRGYSFTDLERGNADLSSWLDRKADRVHGTVHEVVRTRFEREQPLLGVLPLNAFDTSWRVYRKVHKDCAIRFEGNLYVVDHRLVDKKVLLRVKDPVLRIFDNNRLIVSYKIPSGKGHLVQDKRFYEALRKDKRMMERKYQNRKRLKGRAHMTISPLAAKYAMDEVETRDISVYDRACGVT